MKKTKFKIVGIIKCGIKHDKKYKNKIVSCIPFVGNIKCGMKHDKRYKNKTGSMKS